MIAHRGASAHKIPTLQEVIDLAERFFTLGVDGVLADNPDTAVTVRRHLFG